MAVEICLPCRNERHLDCVLTVEENEAPCDCSHGVMSEDEHLLAKQIYEAIQQHAADTDRSRHAAEFKLGISDVGYCPERLRRTLDNQVPEGTDMLAAVIGQAVGKEVEEALKAQLWPDAILQAEVMLRLRIQGKVYNLPGHPDIIRPDWGILDGKGLALNTLLPVPNGWTAMGDLRVGDEVYDRDGARTRVTFKSEVKNIDCWRVTFRTGEQVICDDEHRWVVVDRKGHERVETASWIAEQRQAGRAVTVPVLADACAGDPGVPALDPWLLGYWVGNGQRCMPRVTANLADAEEVHRRVTRLGWRATVTPDKRGSQAALLTIQTNEVKRRADGRMVRSNQFRLELEALGIFETKGFPVQYLRASPSDRKMLLRGLMDSDGTWNKARRRVSFTSTTESVALGLAELARSLGERVQYNAHLAHGYGKEVQAHVVEWTPSFNPFALTRKGSKVQVREAQRHAIASVERVESVPTQCIAVDSPTKTYLCSEGWIPTHNTDFGLSAIERDGPSFQQQFQRHAYGLAAFEAGHFPDLALEDVMVGNFWLDRGAVEKRVHVQFESFNPEIIDRGIDELESVVYAYLNEEEAEKRPPREVCRVTCGYFAKCREWETDVSGLLDDPDAVSAILAYVEGRNLTTRGDKLKREAKAKLDGISGSTGEWLLRQTWTNPTEVPASKRKGHYRIDIKPVRKVDG
jgi:hypothetical protein